MNASVVQKNIVLNYKLLSQCEDQALTINDSGFQCYSQHEEDGILLFIFAMIKSTNKKCVEICAGNGIECNTANLIINHRWIGLQMDGNEKNIASAKEFYSSNTNSMYWPPALLHAWITRENINDLISDSGFAGEIDLLSLDIDGNDYWIWEAIDVINPRVVVLEYNHLAGPERSITIPYDPQFRVQFTQYGSDYAGASLSAFIKLGQKKGYRLVGTNAISTNAFFVRNDVEHRWLPEIKAESCFEHPRAKFGMTERWKTVESKEWEQV